MQRGIWPRFPPDALVYIGATLRRRFTSLKKRKRNACHLFLPSSSPPLFSLSAQEPSAFAAAAVETLKCDVCISSQLLKSLPLSPSEPLLSFSIHGWAPPSLQTPWETGKTLLAGSWNMTLWYSPGWEWVCSNVTYQSEKKEEEGELMRKSIPRLHYSLAKEASICYLWCYWEKLEYNGNHSSPPVCHVKTVSGNSCTLCAHNLSSMRSSAGRDFPKMTKGKKKKTQLWDNKFLLTNPKINLDGIPVILPRGGCDDPQVLHTDL